MPTGYALIYMKVLRKLIPAKYISTSKFEKKMAKARNVGISRKFAHHKISNKYEMWDD